MGMYTELVLKCEVKRGLPEDVDLTLGHLFNDDPLPRELPSHEFFQCETWDLVGSGASYYHVPWAVSRYSERRIFSRSDLKNYHGEIEKFLEWLSPYIEADDGGCIGWYWYEESTLPSLLIYHESGQVEIKRG